MVELRVASEGEVLRGQVQDSRSKSRGRRGLKKAEELSSESSWMAQGLRPDAEIRCKTAEVDREKDESGR